MRRHPEGERGRRRAQVAILAIAAALFAAAAFAWGKSGVDREDERVGAAAIGGAGFVQPVAGVETSLANALVDASLPAVPVLGSIDVPDPCTGSSAPLVLLHTYVSVDSPNSADILGFVYSSGVWMSLSTLDQFDSDLIDQSGELVPVEQALSEDDRPKDLVTGTVNGHVAWVRELSPSFSCTDDGVENGVETTPGAPVPGSAAPIYDPTLTASIRWVENGAMIHLVGPLSLDELTKVAGSATWE